MKKFMDESFQLENKTAQILYEKYAKTMPIFDYHCHLSPKDIYENRKFKDITEAWIVDGVYGDHYKWRIMRARGVGEEYITGSKSSFEKFMQWAKTIPYAIGNPLYHWVHMELKQYFGIDKVLCEATGSEIYDECNKKLETLTARKMIESNNVKVIYTTDDPIDSLEYHLKLSDDQSFKTKVYPAFRPDHAINIDKNEFITWLNKLSEVVGYQITNIDLFQRALAERMDFFAKVGCVLSDHALDEVCYQSAEKPEVAEIFIKRLNNQELTAEDLAKYKGYLLLFLGREYAKRNWVQQYHINALRNNSSKILKQIGPDTGFDSINDSNFIKPLALILDTLDRTNQLPKTILYSLNSKDYETLATLANCFNCKNIHNKVQFGAAWWFNDQLDGMKKQLTILANMGLLCNFVGMLTDSRSFLSYPRHDYFRRLLCSYFGTLIENGEYPNDLEFVGKIVQDICYNNAVEYFKVGQK